MDVVSRMWLARMDVDVVSRYGLTYDYATIPLNVFADMLASLHTASLGGYTWWSQT